MEKIAVVTLVIAVQALFINGELCAPGFMSPTGSEPNCVECPSRYYQSQYGQTSCDPCPMELASPPRSDSIDDCIDPCTIIDCGAHGECETCLMPGNRCSYNITHWHTLTETQYWECLCKPKWTGRFCDTRVHGRKDSSSSEEYDSKSSFSSEE
ncbi:hypothetical protein ScPMuIL_012152 [Solemya velum]